MINISGIDSRLLLIDSFIIYFIITQVVVHVSSDGIKFMIWDTFVASSQTKGQSEIPLVLILSSLKSFSISDQN